MNSENKREIFPIRQEYIDYLENDLRSLFETFSGDARKIGERKDWLISKYSENQRVYHNLSHVFNLLMNAADFKNQIEDYDVFCLVIWFHDAIYEPKSPTNEIESAALAVESLNELSFPQSKIEKVEKKILATQKHDAFGLDSDGKLFLDLDLGILGANRSVYDRYSKAIRAEYSFVPEDLYRTKRREILQDFLKREFIYYTDEWRESHEFAARMNIENEIKELS